MNGAMTSGVTTDEFRSNWIERFELQAQLHRGSPRENAWGGFDAYRELFNTRNLWVVLPNEETGVYPFGFLMEKLSREVRMYKLYDSSVVTANQSFRDGLDVLSSIEKKLKKVKTQESSAKPGVDFVLSQCASAIEKARKSLEQRRDSYWPEVLMAPPEERRNWPIEWPVRFDEKQQIQTIPPEPIAKLEEMLEDVKYPRKLMRQLDLDRRFQLRVATILRMYLQKDDGISLRTISRLTVLTYICGNLRKEGESRLFSSAKEKKGEITVRGVDQKLRAAGVK